MALVDYFLLIDGIEGESLDSKHAKQIDVESWQWGEAQSGTSRTGAGAGAGKVQMQDFSFAMRVNKASPKLLLACADGRGIKKAVLTCRKAGKDQQPYLIYTFSDVLISSYQTGGSNGEVVPIDQITFNFTKIECEYKEQKPDGTLGGPVKTGYDIKLNKAI